MKYFYIIFKGEDFNVRKKVIILTTLVILMMTGCKENEKVTEGEENNTSTEMKISEESLNQKIKEIENFISNEKYDEATKLIKELKSKNSDLSKEYNSKLNSLEEKVTIAEKKRNAKEAITVNEALKILKDLNGNEYNYTLIEGDILPREIKNNYHAFIYGNEYNSFEDAICVHKYTKKVVSYYPDGTMEDFVAYKTVNSNSEFTDKIAVEYAYKYFNNYDDIIFYEGDSIQEFNGRKYYHTREYPNMENWTDEEREFAGGANLGGPWYWVRDDGMVFEDGSGLEPSNTLANRNEYK